jgi:predicted nucleic acid-binding protein
MNSLDTNVLVYCADTQDLTKHEQALTLLALACAENWPIPAQVYGEFYVVATKRGHASRAQAAAQIEAWKLLMPALPSSAEAHRVALQLATQHQLQYWDALIIATCAEHGVKTLYTEDLPSLKKPAGVLVENPFKKTRKR